MIEFWFGFFLALAFAGSLGFTSDRKVRSAKPFAVDDELYICRRVELPKVE